MYQYILYYNLKRNLQFNYVEDITDDLSGLKNLQYL